MGVWSGDEAGAERKAREEEEEGTGATMTGGEAANSRDASSDSPVKSHKEKERGEQVLERGEQGNGSYALLGCVVKAIAHMR